MVEQKKTKEELIGELTTLRRKLAKLERLKNKFREMEKRLHKQTVEYEKLSALGRLTANVAHEIRNPITVIGGLARRINRSAPSEWKEKEYIKLIILEAKRLEDILRDTITFSDKGVLTRCECIMNEIVNEALSLCENTSGDHCIHIRKSLGKLPRVFVDKKQVREAISNIISNSIDAMPGGGTLTVSTGKQVFQKRNYVVVHISDTGVGIPEDKKNLIFEPFFTTKISKKETGLGLPIAKKIVEAHGGFIRVKSSVKKGTTFSLSFPYRTSSDRIAPDGK